MKSYFIRTFLVSSVVLLQACSGGSEPSKTKASIEYIAHASFKITDGNGTAIVIDPYNSRAWLGYDYPSNIMADAILITHPHFDHDASYNLPNGTDVYRDPGPIKIGEISVKGVATEHMGAEDMKKNGQSATNTVWVISIDGRKILHLGDTRPLTDDELANIGSVDIIMTNTGDHDEVSRLKTTLKATSIIPMHYKLPAIAPDGGSGLDLASEWLADIEDVKWLETNIAPLHELDSGVTVFRPHHGVEAWGNNQLQARELYKSAVAEIRKNPPDWGEAKAYLDKGLEFDAGNISLYLLKAQIYEKQKNTAQMAKTMETGLEKATDLDWSVAHYVHSKLYGYYEGIQNLDGMATHKAWIDKAPSGYSRP